MNKIISSFYSYQAKTAGYILILRTQVEMCGMTVEI